MELISYLGVVRRKWWLIFGIPIALGAIIFLTSKPDGEEYQASATLLVNNLALTNPVTTVPPTGLPGDGTTVTQPPVQGPRTLNETFPNEGVLETYTQLISRRVVLQEVIRALVLPYTESELLAKITTERVPDTQLIRITVKDASPSLAAAIANETSAAFISINSLEEGPGSLVVADAAEEPLQPVSSGILPTLILVVVAGFLLSSVLALLAEYLDDKVRTPSDVEIVSGLRTLAVVDRFGSQKGHPRELSTAEDYRELRTNLRVQSEENELRTILVASPGRKEGRSRTALNLGYMLAEAGERVILVDADLRQATLHQMTGTDNSRGLSNLLQTHDLSRLRLQPVAERLEVLTAGPMPSNPSIISFPHMWDLLTELRSRADYVILDSPALLAVVDASDLARFVDGIILLAESGKTSAESFKAAVGTLERNHAKIIGVVLNKGHSQRRAQRSYKTNNSARPVTKIEPPVSLEKRPQAPAPRRGRQAARSRGTNQAESNDAVLTDLDGDESVEVNGRSSNATPRQESALDGTGS